ncbi:YEATS transcription stimulator family protein (plasmid) [Stanieria cyanosphaera PCC 7437]|uniref:YEATS transcription stimulator family protein n=1 Tax=Stanieria cyanosphaera (strain ATCC 29371 / PCC 7437) TaxID=111780 RepID=K9Y025_STAC7|nr:pYEATS domain-containing protein [Stanieria cyanosphaera]AFZ38190.1 YEATS transcription stimulator family protein [Stanieria cyanosphaera PCC 7437]
MANNRRNTGSDGKKESILEKIFVPVIIALLTAGTAPFWLQMLLDLFKPTPEPTSNPPYASSSNIRVSNNSQRVGGGRWDWTVYIDEDSSTISKIDCVEYTLHPTFSNRFQRVCNSPTNNFALSSNGWGEFNIRANASKFRDEQK